MKRQDFTTDDEYLDSLNALAASTLEGLSEEEKREITRRPEMITECEREVIDAAIEFRKRRMDIRPDAERKSIFDAGPTFDAQLNDFIRAIDRLVEEREKQ